MTNGLRKVGNYEDTLAAALKDELHLDGVISPYLANAATRIINNPEFQRVKDRLEDDLTQQTRNHLETKQFEHHVTNLAVDAHINRSDLEYIIGNLQKPPQPPAPPPPQNDAEADRARLIAELDGLAQQRERSMRDEIIAQQNARDLAAQSVSTPAQEIVREYHHTQTPIYIPTPQVPPRENYSDMMRQFGMTMQQMFLSRQQEEPIYRRPPDDIPITYAAGNPPPPPAPGAGAIARSYGPARIPKSRYEPFLNTGPPPPGSGGATAPMPVPVPVRRFSRYEIPIRREYFPQKPVPTIPPPDPPAPPQRPIKRKGEIAVGMSKVPRQSRFPGQGHQLPHDTPFIPFSGRAQRLPDEHGLRANAIQRMRELGHRGMQRRRAGEMIDRMDDLGRAVRRGGQQGDVVGPGKRKRDTDFAPNPRQRVGGRPAGPQQFSIAT